MMDNKKFQKVNNQYNNKHHKLKKLNSPNNKQQQIFQNNQQPTTKQNKPPQQQTPTNISKQSSQNSNEASSGSSVEVNDHLKLIAQRESGGDITAINPSSGAAGKYQFLQTTWDSVAPAEYVGVSPASAPEHVQDAAAQKLYNEVGPSQWVTAYM